MNIAKEKHYKLEYQSHASPLMEEGMFLENYTSLVLEEPLSYMSNSLSVH